MLGHVRGLKIQTQRKNRMYAHQESLTRPVGYYLQDSPLIFELLNSRRPFAEGFFRVSNWLVDDTHDLVNLRVDICVEIGHNLVNQAATPIAIIAHTLATAPTHLAMRALVLEWCIDI